MKTCGRCKKELPLEDFNRDSSAGDGRQGRCRACQVAGNRDWVRRNAETRRAAARRYYERTGRDRSSKQPKYPAVYRKVARAIKRGDLVRPSICSECGEAHENIHAHHDDYDKPLEVRWLCTWCHGATHHPPGKVLA